MEVENGGWGRGVGSLGSRRCLNLDFDDEFVVGWRAFSVGHEKNITSPALCALQPRQATVGFENSIRRVEYIYIFKHQSSTSHPILGQINMVSPHLSTAIKHFNSITPLSTTNQRIYPHITVSLPPSTLSIASRTSNSSITAPKLYHRVSIFQRVTTLESTYP